MVHCRTPVLYGCRLIVCEWDCGNHTLKVDLCFEELRLRRLLGHVEVASCAGHPMRALFEKAVGAVTMTKVIVLPRCSCCGRTALDDVTIDEHLDGSDVPREIARVTVRLGERVRSDAGVVLRAGR